MMHTHQRLTLFELGWCALTQKARSYGLKTSKVSRAVTTMRHLRQLPPRYFGLNLTLSRLTFYFTRQQCSQTLAAAASWRAS